MKSETIQGYPFSLLFSIVLTVAIILDKQKTIKDIRIGKEETILLLYAYPMIVCIEKLKKIYKFLTLELPARLLIIIPICKRLSLLITNISSFKF